MKPLFLKNVLLVALVPMAVHADDMAQYKKQSVAAIKEFGGKLKGELQKAMKAGGPVKAITVCSEKAPAIASEVSKKHKLKIARTSLKFRNPGNKPDAWELKVLKQFEQRKARGEKPANIAYAEIVNMDGKKVYRFMKAIPTGKLCLNCHGSQIKPEVMSKLKTLYPSDMATGFKQGDIRGAFTVSKELN